MPARATYRHVVNREPVMSWKPVIVGVDASPAGGHAAQLGLMIAAAADVECRLVHATRDVRTVLPDTAQTAQAAAFRAAALHSVRERLNVALEGAVPWKNLNQADVKEGWAPAVLDDAGLIEVLPGNGDRKSTRLNSSHLGI